MTNTVTISLSLGSGPKAQELALRIKAGAAGRPISEFIRNAVEAHLDSMGLRAQSEETQK